MRLNAAKCEKFLDNLTEDEPPTLEDFTTAMGNLRQHSEYTEPYFYETAYTNYGTNICRVCNSFSDNVYTVIPIDKEGSARFFQQSETDPTGTTQAKMFMLTTKLRPGSCHSATNQAQQNSQRIETISLSQF